VRHCLGNAALLFRPRGSFASHPAQSVQAHHCSCSGRQSQAACGAGRCGRGPCEVGGQGVGVMMAMTASLDASHASPTSRTTHHAHIPHHTLRTTRNTQHGCAPSPLAPQVLLLHIKLLTLNIQYTTHHTPHTPHPTPHTTNTRLRHLHSWLRRCCCSTSMRPSPMSCPRCCGATAGCASQARPARSSLRWRLTRCCPAW